MPHVLQRHAHVTREHAPHDHLWAAGTLALSVLCLALALAERFDAGAVVAAACVLVGGWSMLVSRTTTQRFETVVGTVLGGTVLAVCLAYGSGL